MKSNTTENTLLKNKILSTAHLSVEEAVYKILSDYLAKNSYMTFNSLENSDIKKTTIRSILMSKGTHKLMPRTLCGIMRSLHKGQTIKQISTLYEGPLGKALKLLVDDYGDNSDFEYEDEQIETLLEDINTYKIILMASSIKGTSRRELISELGNQCREVLDRLLKEKVLIKKNKRIYNQRNHIYKDKMIGITTTQKMAANLISSSFWPDNFGVSKYGNALNVKLVEVNGEWYRPRALKIHKKHQEELEELYNHPEAKGDDKHWHVDAYCDLINPKNNHNEEEDQSDNKDIQ